MVQRFQEGGSPINRITRRAARRGAGQRLHPDGHTPAPAQILIIGISILVALGTAGCGDRKVLPTEPGDDPIDPTATFARVQAEVFDISCAFTACHGASAPRAGMNLSARSAYDNIVGVPSTQRSDLDRIEPFAPNASYMIKKLRGDPDIVGSPMPLTGQLSGDQLQLLVDWVRRGAPRDG